MAPAWGSDRGSRSPARPLVRLRPPRAGADAWATTRSLEWLTWSPIPASHYPVLPVIHGRDEWAWRRAHGLADRVPDHYFDIVMPKNTPVPLILGALSFALGFGLSERCCYGPNSLWPAWQA